MEAKSARFNEASEQFLDHYDTVRGHVRQEVTRHNLAQLLPGSGPLQALDFGGGDGRDTIWLAGDAMRDHVTLLDESPEMLAQAITLIQGQKIPVRRRIKVLEGNLAMLEDQQFDLILSHGVLMYELDEPLEQLQQLAARLRTGGILSLLTKGYEAARVKGDNPEKAGKFNDDGIYMNRLGLPTRVYRFSELEDLVEQAGLTPTDRYGVRLLSDDDRRPIKDVSRAALSKVITREIKASRDPKRIEQAQMLHVIAVKK